MRSGSWTRHDDEPAPFVGLACPPAVAPTVVRRSRRTHPRRPAVSETRWCYIDGCPNEATLIVESYPDDITLCDDHLDCRGEISPLDADWDEETTP